MQTIEACLQNTNCAVCSDPGAAVDVTEIMLGPWLRALHNPRLQPTGHQIALPYKDKIEMACGGLVVKGLD